MNAQKKPNILTKIFFAILLALWAWGSIGYGLPFFLLFGSLVGMIVYAVGRTPNRR